jgi:hypothetical protein
MFELLFLVPAGVYLATLTETSLCPQLVMRESRYPTHQVGPLGIISRYRVRRVASHRRKAQDGAIAAKYPMFETPSAAYVLRTQRNFRDTGGAVIFSVERELTGGSKKAVEFAVHQRCSRKAERFRRG